GRAGRARSSALRKSVRSAGWAAAAIPAARSTMARIPRLATRDPPLFAKRDPFERALRFDARLDRVGGSLDPPDDALVHRIEALRRAREVVDEAEEVAFVQRAGAQLHP